MKQFQLLTAYELPWAGIDRRTQGLLGRDIVLPGLEIDNLRCLLSAARVRA